MKASKFMELMGEYTYNTMAFIGFTVTGTAFFFLMLTIF